VPLIRLRWCGLYRRIRCRRRLPRCADYGTPFIRIQFGTFTCAYVCCRVSAVVLAVPRCCSLIVYVAVERLAICCALPLSPFALRSRLLYRWITFAALRFAHLLIYLRVAVPRCHTFTFQIPFCYATPTFVPAVPVALRSAVPLPFALPS